MKLPHHLRSAGGDRPSPTIPGSQHSGRVTPLDVFVRQCEENCLRLEDSALRERCLRSCGYPAEL